MRNIKITISYDGTSYHGFQVQKNDITIQETLQNALFKITGERINVIGCGRTDAGVHAICYTASFRTQSSMPPDKYVYALNAMLPPDIVCLSSSEADIDFHAKNSAKKKHYTYKILNSELADPFLRNYAWHFKYPLDAEKMQRAAKAFVGEHDFEGFSSSGRSVKTTVRTIYSLDVTKSGNIITIDVIGNGFLYNMVRIIAGTLTAVGTGRIPYEDIPDIISSCDRTRAGITAPPQGLYLTEVIY